MPEKVGWVIGRYRARLETPPDKLTEREPHLQLEFHRGRHLLGCERGGHHLDGPGGCRQCPVRDPDVDGDGHDHGSCHLLCRHRDGRADPVQPCGAVAGAAPRGLGVPRRGRPFLSRHRPVGADLPGAGPRVGRRVQERVRRGVRLDRPAGGGGGHRGRNPHAHRHPRDRRGRRRRDIHLHAEIYSGCQTSHWRRNTAANRSSGSR